MADHIPFVYSTKDCTILRKTYTDSVAVRVSLDTVGKVISHLPTGPLKWLDPAIDGIDRWKNPASVSDPYKAHIKRFVGHEQMIDPAFHKAPKKEIIGQFVNAVLNECMKAILPDWLSVPQLPVVSDSGRNKINRHLAEATGVWRSSNSFGGKLILPVIITHKNQIQHKTDRNKRIDALQSCLQLSKADGYWLVDCSLRDQEGAQPLESVRFPALINLHQEATEVVSKDLISVAGPYWGMNLILWARGLVRYPAINLGKSYQYHLPGGKLPAGSERVALPPLKRWAVASPQLETWLHEAVKHTPKGDSANAQFAEVLHNFSHLMSESKEQVATFYKNWFDKLAAVPAPGRSLALFQDFSSAYVLGKSLKELPAKEGSGRKAERVAKQFMVNCL